jgi:hypothetical protein
MDDSRQRSLRSGDELRDAPAVVTRRRRIAQLTGSGLILTTVPFASASSKLPPYKGD